MSLNEMTRIRGFLIDFAKEIEAMSIGLAESLRKRYQEAVDLNPYLKCVEGLNSCFNDLASGKRSDKSHTLGLRADHLLHIWCPEIFPTESSIETLWKNHFDAMLMCLAEAHDLTPTLPVAFTPQSLWITDNSLLPNLKTGFVKEDLYRPILRDVYLSFLIPSENEANFPVVIGSNPSLTLMDRWKQEEEGHKVAAEESDRVHLLFVPQSKVTEVQADFRRPFVRVLPLATLQLLLMDRVLKQASLETITEHPTSISRFVLDFDQIAVPIYRTPFPCMISRRHQGQEMLQEFGPEVEPARVHLYRENVHLKGREHHGELHAARVALFALMLKKEFEKQKKVAMDDYGVAMAAAFYDVGRQQCLGKDSRDTDSAAAFYDAMRERMHDSKRGMLAFSIACKDPSSEKPSGVEYEEAVRSTPFKYPAQVLIQGADYLDITRAIIGPFKPEFLGCHKYNLIPKEILDPLIQEIGLFVKDTEKGESRKFFRQTPHVFVDLVRVFLFLNKEGHYPTMATYINPIATELRIEVPVRDPRIAFVA